MHKLVADAGKVAPTTGQELQLAKVLETTGDFRGMVNGFVNSLEYRFRFGP